MFTFDRSLNPDQQAAIQHAAGPALILAGAGSGKTTVLTHHAAWLIKEKGVSPEEILLVTFTNKAAQEMIDRITTLTGLPLQYSGTFHSVCARILRKHAPLLGLSHSFVIYDADDQLSLIKALYKEHNYPVAQLKPQAARAKISEAKNELKSPADVLHSAGDDQDILLAKVYQHYQVALTEAQAVDFDDLLLLSIRLFTEHDLVAQRYQTQFQHVLVDEYQDTNKAQYALTKLWGEPQNNIFVVGDFCQSIYSWRGADFRNMLQYKEDFPEHEEYKLEQNYRSNQSILDAASSVIKHNTSHPTLTLWTDRTDDEYIRVLESYSSDDEARAIGLELLKNNTPLNETVILYRTNAQSRSFEEQFIRLGVPYRLIGGVRFYERKEIKDVISFARLTINPKDAVSYQRIAKLGKRKLASFLQWAEKQTDFGAQSAAPALQEILTVSDYLAAFDERLPEDQARIDNVLELLALAQHESTLTTLLERIALLQDTDQLEQRNQKNGVLLMSLHSAKGLEFERVYLVGMEEGLLPHSRSFYDTFQMEEERRLCYVGITRAKKYLTLSYAKNRYMYGKGVSSTPSRFLGELPINRIRAAGISQGKSSSNIRSVLGASGAAHNSMERRIISDDDLDALLKGEVSVGTFLDS